jgi:hypothetical protein
MPSRITTKAARNEVRKLRAAFLNNLAIAFVTAGFVIPLITYSQSYPGPLPPDSFDNIVLTLRYISIIISAILTGIVLHLFAVRVLVSLED